MVKKRYCVTLDSELVDLHKIKSLLPLSTEINNYLQESLMVADELEEVSSEIEKCEKKLQILRPKLARLEQIRINEIQNQNNYGLVHDTLLRMQEANGCIGKNQLRLLAENRKLNYQGLLEYCLEHSDEFKIVDVGITDVNDLGVRTFPSK